MSTTTRRPHAGRTPRAGPLSGASLRLPRAGSDLARPRSSGRAEKARLRPHFPAARNRRGGGEHSASVECDDARELLSARLDGEATAAENRVADRHLEDCARCRSWWFTFEPSSCAMRLRSAPHMPDLVEAVLRQTAPRRRRHASAARVALAAIAGFDLAAASADLVARPAGHATSHVAAMQLAVAIGYGYAAWRPAKAEGMMVVAGVLTAALLATGALDVYDARTTRLAEASHLVTLVGFASLWWLRRGGFSGPRPAPGSRPSRSWFESAPGVGRQSS